jgi:uncharacterized protein HemX
MDNSRFDQLARKLSAAESRRGAVTTLAAASLGLGLTRFGLGDALARKKKNKKKKKKKKNKNNNTNPNENTKNLSEACSNTDECIGDLLCQVANSQQSCPGQEVGTYCCVPTDVQAQCNTSCDCCGLDVICNGGYCQSA